MENDQDNLEKIAVYGVQNATQWDIGNMTLKNIVGYCSLDTETFHDTDGTGVNLLHTELEELDSEQVRTSRSHGYLS